MRSNVRIELPEYLIPTENDTEYLTREQVRSELESSRLVIGWSFTTEAARDSFFSNSNSPVHRKGVWHYG